MLIEVKKLIDRVYMLQKDNMEMVLIHGLKQGSILLVKREISKRWINRLEFEIKEI